MWKYLVLAALVPAVVMSLNFDACPNEPTPTMLFVVGCSMQPCTIVNGQPVEFTVTFNNRKNIGNEFNSILIDTILNSSITATPTTTITREVIGLLGGIRVPLELPPDFTNGCNFLTGGGSCPLAGGENLTAVVNLPIDLPFSDIFIRVEYRLVNSAGNPIICLRFGINLVN